MIIFGYTNKKAQFQISFKWLFAIIVGGFILFLSIYAATKLIGTGGEATSARTGAEIGVLLNPLETGFESSVVTLLSMPVDTRIHNECSSISVFGEQRIRLSQKNLNSWSETDVDISFRNKYLFSENPVEGKDFFIFSKPFEFPFKISDVIYITSSKQNYCFVDPPEDIRDELENLNQDNILLGDCSQSEGVINVCFNGGSVSCDITVNENLKSVEKRGERVYYETDSLLYAAIFSDKDTYECQVKRLMNRAKQLSELYGEKSDLISTQCTSNVNLLGFSSSINSYQDSSSLVFIKNSVEEIESQNRAAECRLW